MTDPSMREHITLNRNPGLRDTTLIGIGAMIGAGIYFFQGGNDKPWRVLQALIELENVTR